MRRAVRAREEAMVVCVQVVEPKLFLLNPSPPIGVGRSLSEYCRFGYILPRLHCVNIFPRVISSTEQRSSTLRGRNLLLTGDSTLSSRVASRAHDICLNLVLDALLSDCFPVKIKHMRLRCIDMLQQCVLGTYFIQNEII